MQKWADEVESKGFLPSGRMLWSLVGCGCGCGCGCQWDFVGFGHGWRQRFLLGLFNQLQPIFRFFSCLGFFFFFPSFLSWDSSHLTRPSSVSLLRNSDSFIISHVHGTCKALWRDIRLTHSGALGVQGAYNKERGGERRGNMNGTARTTSTAMTHHHHHHHPICDQVLSRY